MTHPERLKLFSGLAQQIRIEIPGWHAFPIPASKYHLRVFKPEPKETFDILFLQFQTHPNVLLNKACCVIDLADPDWVQKVKNFNGGYIQDPKITGVGVG